MSLGQGAAATPAVEGGRTLAGVDDTVAQAELLEQVEGLGPTRQDGLGTGVDPSPGHGRGLELAPGVWRGFEHGDGGSVATEAVRGRES